MISGYVSHYKPINDNSGKAKQIKARAKEIIDKVELRAQDRVKIDQSPEDSYKEIGHAFIKKQEAGQNGSIHEMEQHIKFTPAEGNGKPEVNYMIDVDKNTANGELVSGTGYTKFNCQTALTAETLQDITNYGITERDPGTGKYTKEEVEVSVNGPGVKYSLKDMNDPEFREETYFLSKDDIGL